MRFSSRRLAFLSCVVLAAALGLVACGDDSASPGTDAATDTGSAAADTGPADTGDHDGGAEPPDAGSMDAASPGDDAGSLDSGAGATDAGAIELDDAGCLTFQSASRICGFMSDDRVCNFSVGCGTSESVSQCGINCEMGTTVSCYSADSVACLQRAVDAMSCADLMACHWIL